MCIQNGDARTEKRLEGELRARTQRDTDAANQVSDITGVSIRAWTAGLGET